MTDQKQLQDIYRDTVLEHSRNPRSFGRLADANHEAEGFNPLCGDKITVFLNVADQKIDECSFEATGCAISIASASLMMGSVQGKKAASVTALIQQVKDMFGKSGNAVDETIVPSLEALSGVRAYPSRVKCATLPWSTLEMALAGDSETATTE